KRRASRASVNCVSHSDAQAGQGCASSRPSDSAASRSSSRSAASRACAGCGCTQPQTGQVGALAVGSVIDAQTLVVLSAAKDLLSFACMDEAEAAPSLCPG